MHRTTLPGHMQFSRFVVVSKIAARHSVKEYNISKIETLLRKTNGNI